MAASLLITQIGELVTNAPGEAGRFAVINDAALVIEGDRVTWTGSSARAPGRVHHRVGGGRPGGRASPGDAISLDDQGRVADQRECARTGLAGSVRH